MCFLFLITFNHFFIFICFNMFQHFFFACFSSSCSIRIWFYSINDCRLLSSLKRNLILLNFKVNLLSTSLLIFCLDLNFISLYTILIVFKVKGCVHHFSFFYQIISLIKNVFLFHLKSSFCSPDIQIFVFSSSLLFFCISHCWRKILKVYDITNCQNKNLIMPFVWYLEKEKFKLCQLIEY